jgi:formyltetrahydrofolate synthetase
MLISQDNLDFCQKGLMNTKKHHRKSGISTIVDINKNIKINTRKIRSVSIWSYLLCEGSSILDLENSLHNTIDQFNSNFQSMVDFDDNLVASLSSLQNDIEGIGNQELNLHDAYLQMKQELEYTKNHFSYLTLKTQHIQAMEDILHKSELHENLNILQRAIFSSNVCNFIQLFILC